MSPGREAFLEPAGERDLPLPSQVLSALTSHGCCSGTKELSAKPSQRIICELRVWVSAMETNAAESLREPKK